MDTSLHSRLGPLMTDVIVPLIADVMICRTNIGEGKQSSFWKRSYVRSLFSLIEAELFMAAESVLEAHAAGTIKLALGDEVLLREDNYYVKDNGTLRVKKTSPPIESKVRLTFRCLAALRNPVFELDVSSDGWVDFQSFIDIRNRITHPKKKEDLEISDAEMEKIQRAEDWYREMSLKLLFPNFTGTMPELRAVLQEHAKKLLPVQKQQSSKRHKPI